ncbi:MAG: tetratricopeptide repeat protein, partial [Planctomycetes bacterium]|nr:tetratricopeptide repeat protein [Planctomycetota bacterium]
MDFLRKWLVGRDLKRARALEGEGYLDQALPVYESCLELASEAERVVALRGIGSCGLRLGKLARAREALAECVKLSPGDPDALLLLGQVQMELRDTIGAEEAFAEALKHAPDRVDILHAQSEVYAVKFPRAAFEAGKRVIAHLIEKPDEAERLRFPRELPVVFLRNLAIEQRFSDETIAYFDELAGKGARWIKPVALNHKGILMANTGRLDEAVKAYLDALSADPDFDAAHFNLGLVHARRRDFDAAKASLSVYAKRHPTDAIATYGFGFLAETKPDVQEMLRLYAFFLERMKSNPPAAASLGRLDIARGWVQHVETVVDHAKRHQAEGHENPPPPA